MIGRFYLCEFFLQCFAAYFHIWIEKLGRNRYLQW